MKTVWRPLLFVYAAFLIIAPVCVLALVDEGLLPLSVEFLARLSPFSSFDGGMSDFLTRFDSILAVNLGWMFVLLTTLALVRLATRVRGRRAAQSAGVAVLFCCFSFGLAPVAEAIQFSEGTNGFLEVEGDLPLEVVRVRRGFDGTVFHEHVDFLTIVVRNRGADTVSGRVWRRIHGLDIGPEVRLEVGAQTTSVVRLGSVTADGALSPQSGSAVQLVFGDA